MFSIPSMGFYDSNRETIRFSPIRFSITFFLTAMTYAAILFDFDDCLFFTVDDRARNSVMTLHENGFSDATFEEAKARIGGDTALRLMATAGIEDREKGEQLAAYYEEVNRREGYPTASPYPETMETLEALHDYPMGIFSASIREAIEGVLDRHGIRERLSSIVGLEDAEPKPSPDGILKLCKTLEVDPTRCLYVGDNPKDIRTGKAAGTRTAAVLHGIGTYEDLKKENPDTILDRFSDLIVYVREGIS